MIHNADILVVTVTNPESKAVVEVFQRATGTPPTPVLLDDRIYHDLGIINESRVFMVQSEKGSSGLGASQQTVQNGITALSPDAVIMVGIAFGVNPEKQSIGDILVSQRLSLYELQRVGTQEGEATIIPRGDRPHAPTRLFNRFQSAELYWDKPRVKVSFGLILSGEKLVDNIDFRKQIQQFEPEAIGGEMEGAGLYVACQASNVDWILVKAICDWADGHKGRDEEAQQLLAARNAARYALHVLQLASPKPDSVTTNGITQTTAGPVSIAHALRQKNKLRNEVLSTGYSELDTLLGGLRQSQLIIVAGDNGVGTKGFLVSIIAHVAIELHRPVAIFALNNSLEEVLNLLIVAASRIGADRPQTRTLQEDEQLLVDQAISSLSNAPIYIDDSLNSVQKILSTALRLHSKDRFDLLVILDHLQMITTETRGDNRVDELVDITRALKKLARRLDVPVLVETWPNPSIRSRVDKRPLLSDLPGQGAISRLSDVVVMLHREGFESTTAEYMNKLTVFVSQNRNGPIGAVDLYFDPKSRRFESMPKN